MGIERMAAAELVERYGRDAKFCKACGYPLVGVVGVVGVDDGDEVSGEGGWRGDCGGDGACPECGAGFDFGDAKTFWDVRDVARSGWRWESWVSLACGFCVLLFPHYGHRFGMSMGLIDLWEWIGLCVLIGLGMGLGLSGVRRGKWGSRFVGLVGLIVCMVQMAALVRYMASWIF